MYIYKITNDVNDKMYIGQTIKTVEERFKRHITDAMHNILDTHFARAIRLIGPEHFKVEIIDTATSQEELTDKEYYWINYYDATHLGYNETNNKLKSGGNTYASKTAEEMDIIKDKLRQTKMGSQNPNSHAIKCKNVKTNEIKHFTCMKEAQEFFNTNDHSALGKRCRGLIKSLYKGEWDIKYEEDEFSKEVKYGISTYNSKDIKVINLDTNEEKIYKSGAEVERTYNLTKATITRTKKKYGTHFVIGNLDITILE